MSNWLQFIADETTVVIVPPTALITKPNMVWCGVCLLYRQFFMASIIKSGIGPGECDRHLAFSDTDNISVISQPG